MNFLYSKSLKLGICIILAINVSCYKQKQYEDLPANGEISVLTYNVAGLPEGINSDQFPIKHTPLISPLLNAYDVVNVQEDFAYHDILYKDITAPYKTKYEAKKVFGDGLNTISKIPFIDFRRIAWYSCANTDCLTPKGFSYCRLRINADTYIDLYNVHCNAGSDGNSLIARRSNIMQLSNFIKANSANNAIILMGDFNCRYTRTGDIIRKIDSLGLTNSWIELIRNNVYPNFDDNSLMNCDAPTHPECEVADKILHRSSDKIKLTATKFQLDSTLFYDAEGMPLSDHFPMFTTLKYNVLR